MQVRIGVQSVPKELVIETNSTAEEVQQLLDEALESETGVFVLNDGNGGRVCVPAAKLAYLELGSSEQSRMGFGSF